MNKAKSLKTLRQTDRSIEAYPLDFLHISGAPTFVVEYPPKATSSEAVEVLIPGVAALLSRWLAPDVELPAGLSLDIAFPDAAFWDLDIASNSSPAVFGQDAVASADVPLDIVHDVIPTPQSPITDEDEDDHDHDAELSAEDWEILQSLFPDPPYVDVDELIRRIRERAFTPDPPRRDLNVFWYSFAPPVVIFVDVEDNDSDYDDLGDDDFVFDPADFFEDD